MWPCCANPAPGVGLPWSEQLDARPPSDVEERGRRRADIEYSRRWSAAATAVHRGPSCLWPYGLFERSERFVNLPYPRIPLSAAYRLPMDTFVTGGGLETRYAPSSGAEAPERGKERAPSPAPAPVPASTNQAAKATPAGFSEKRTPFDSSGPTRLPTRLDEERLLSVSSRDVPGLTRAQQRAWEKAFCSALGKDIVRDAFWFTVEYEATRKPRTRHQRSAAAGKRRPRSCSLTARPPPEWRCSDLPPMEAARFEERLARNVLAMEMRLAPAARDVTRRALPHAITRAVVLGMHVAFPDVRDAFTPAAKDRVQRQCWRWFLGQDPPARSWEHIVQGRDAAAVQPGAGPQESEETEELARARSDARRRLRARFDSVFRTDRSPGRHSRTKAEALAMAARNRMGIRAMRVGAATEATGPATAPTESAAVPGAPVPPQTSQGGEGGAPRGRARRRPRRRGPALPKERRHPESAATKGEPEQGGAENGEAAARSRRGVVPLERPRLSDRQPLREFATSGLARAALGGQRQPAHHFAMRLTHAAVPETLGLDEVPLRDRPALERAYHGSVEGDVNGVEDQPFTTVAEVAAKARQRQDAVLGEYREEADEVEAEVGKIERQSKREMSTLKDRNRKLLRSQEAISTASNYIMLYMDTVKSRRLPKPSISAVGPVQ